MTNETACAEVQLTVARAIDFIGASAVLTGPQIRAARALLKWSCQELADHTGISYGSLQKAENAEGMPDMRTRNLATIKRVFEQAGIVFIDGPYSGDGGPGVRLK